MPRVLLVPSVLVVGTLVTGCQSARSESPAPPIHHLEAHAWLTNAVTPQEGILGRVARDAGGVRLLTSGRRVVTLDVPARRMTSVTIAEGDTDDPSLFGFAALPDGTLWTLSGWRTLVQLSEQGKVIGRRTLDKGQTGLQSGFDRLLYQPLDFTGGTPALVADAPEGGRREVWGSLRVRDGPGQGAVRMAQSLATCGVTVGERMPCWQTNAAQVEVIDRTGRGSPIAIPALASWVWHDAVAFSNRPHRLIRDAWLTRDDGMWDGMWIVVRPAAGDVPDRRGEQGLWRVAVSGEVTERHLLPSRARLIVGVEPGRVFLLMADGDVIVVEV